MTLAERASRPEYRGVVRFAAWLLTPVVIWAASFGSGWLGATLGGRPGWLVVGGMAGGIAAAVGWALLLIRVGRRWKGGESGRERDGS